MKAKDLDISTMTDAELADIYMSQPDPGGRRSRKPAFRARSRSSPASFCIQGRSRAGNTHGARRTYMTCGSGCRPASSRAS